MQMSTAIYLGALVLVILMAICYRKTGRFLQCAAFTIFSGVGALGVLWLLRPLLGLTIQITPLTVLVSGVLGVPGVAGLLILQLI